MIPRRAVFVSNLFPSSTEPRRGLYNLDQLRALRDRGLDVEVISSRPWFPGRGRGGRGGAVSPPSVETIDGFRVTHRRALYLPLSRGALNGRLYGWSVRSSIQAAVKRLRTDLIWASFAFPDGVGVAGVARSLRMPLVISVLGSDVNVSFRLPGRRAAMLAAFAEARLVLLKSERLRSVLAEAGVDPTRLVVAYNGVAVDNFRPRDPACACADMGADAAKKRLLFVGNLVPIKGLRVLLTAWKTVADAWPPGSIELALVGQGPLEQELRSQAHSLGIESSLRFVGPEPRDRVATWMAASTALVLPSLEEGVPNVMLEAFASGRPVVASDVGGIAEIHPGESAGALVPANDPTALARGIDMTLRREWDPERLRTIVSHMTWPWNARQVLAAMALALRQPESPRPRGSSDEAVADRVSLPSGR